MRVAMDAMQRREKLLKYRRTWLRQKREQWRAEGRCYLCGQAPLFKDRTCCKPCVMRNRVCAQVQYRKRTAEKAKRAGDVSSLEAPRPARCKPVVRVEDAGADRMVHLVEKLIRLGKSAML